MLKQHEAIWLWDHKETLDQQAPSCILWIGYLVHCLICPVLCSASRCNTAHLHYGQAAQYSFSIKPPKNTLKQAICNSNNQVKHLKTTCKYQWWTGVGLIEAHKNWDLATPCDVMSLPRVDSSPVWRHHPHHTHNYLLLPHTYSSHHIEHSSSSLLKTFL